MKILITGVNGFVGSNLAKMLGIDNYIIGTGTRESSTVKVDDYFKWNMAEEECPFDKLPEELDAIIHAGACLDKNNCNEQLIQVNCLGTQRILQLAKYKNVKKVFYISSVPVIGEPLEHPITESHPLAPQTVYHATKLAGEWILNQLIQEEIEVVHLRVPSPIGPGMPVKTILPIFVGRALAGETIQIMGQGSRRQNYLDVRDLGNVIKGCLALEHISGTYHIGSDETISNLELAKLCVELTKSISAIEFTGMEDKLDSQIWDVDSTKAKEKLNYRQSYQMRDSLLDIIAQMRGE